MVISCHTTALIGECGDFFVEPFHTSRFYHRHSKRSNGGTGQISFGQGWLYSNGGTGALAASTSPTVAYITATSTTASVFPYASTTALTVSGLASTSNLVASNSFTLANLTGLLFGTNGVVSSLATSSLNLSIPLASTTGTTDNIAQGSTNRYYSDNLVNSYVNGSSTIAKLYTANAWNALQTFGNNISSAARN